MRKVNAKRETSIPPFILLTTTRISFATNLLFRETGKGGIVRNIPRVRMANMVSASDSNLPLDPGLTIIRQVTDTIVRCNGRITSDTTHALKATVKPLFTEGKRVVLDLTDVNFLDSSGLGAIVGIYISAKLANCQLMIVYSNETVQRLFRLTKLDQLLADVA